MTVFIDVEPELQPEASDVPPSTPKRTAVGTDDHEKRPCKKCGHTKTDHLGAQGCNAIVPRYPEMRSLQIQVSLTVSTCGCPRYIPKES